MMLADEHGRSVTYAEFLAWAERVAAGLHGLGVGAGAVVSWQLPTRMESVVLAMALSRLGAVQNPIIHLYREREVASLLRTTRAQWFVVPGVWRQFDYEAMARAIQDRVTDREPFAILNGYADLAEGDPAALPTPPTDGDAVRWLYSTSGTTSEPKAVCHSDRSLIAGGIGISEALRPEQGAINCMPFPFAHIGGPDNLVMTLRTGMPLVLVEAFGPDSFAVFARLGVTHLGGSTAHYLAVLAEHTRLGGSPIPTLHTMCGGGAPKPAELYWRVAERTGVRIYHGYGMTECPMIACGAVGDADEQLANSDGAPVVDCTVLVVDDQERPAATGVDGDILVSGPMLAKGYMDAEQTRESFRDDGFFRTGDRGHLRNDGHVVITGRSKELIIRKGENISPREIEDVLMGHPSIGAVAVIGLADPERGERVCAVVETAPGAAPLTFSEMVARCRDAGLMAQKIPEQLEIVDVLPRNPTMKILKRELVERLTRASPDGGGA
jgi:acyl-CoA synthetase (AMP-forming)/AMP-acid ligase II